MLVLTRKAGQILEIKPNPALDLETPIGELFTHGPIEVITLTTHRSQIKIGIRANRGFLVLRRERGGREG